MLLNKKFILASSSLSRYKILKNNNLNFIKIKPTCHEEKIKKKLVKQKKSPSSISLELSKAKAESVSKKIKNKIVVGCDTIIVFNNTLLSKAKNLTEAKKKLSNFRAKNISCIQVFLFFTTQKKFGTVIKNQKLRLEN